MARHRTTKQNRQSRNAKARRRRVVGVGTSAGAFLAFGLTPLATAPAAHADEFELIIDPPSIPSRVLTCCRRFLKGCALCRRG